MRHPESSCGSGFFMSIPVMSSINDSGAVPNKREPNMINNSRKMRTEGRRARISDFGKTLHSLSYKSPNYEKQIS